MGTLSTGKRKESVRKIGALYYKASTQELTLGHSPGALVDVRRPMAYRSHTEKIWVAWLGERSGGMATEVLDLSRHPTMPSGTIFWYQLGVSTNLVL